MTEGSAGRYTGARPRVGVSSCLLGEQVRYNGGHSRSRFLTDELGPYIEWVPYCPEVEIGLGVPRETLRLTVDGRLVSRSGAADHTAAVAALPLPAWRVVAAAGSAPRDATEAAYRDVFVAAMNARPTKGRNANPLHHAFGHISRDLSHSRQADPAARIDSYRRGADPLSVPWRSSPTTPATANCPGSPGSRTWSRTPRSGCGTTWPADVH